MPGGIHPPLEVMLAWPRPNHVNPVARSSAPTIIASVFAPLGIFLLFARLWVRMRMQHNTGWDDWLMIVAAFPMIIVTVLIPLVPDTYQFNKHAWDIEPHFLVIQRKYLMAIQSIYCVASGLIKISILLFYRRLSSRAVSNSFRWATRLTIAFIAAYSIAFALVPIFGCRPISAFWDTNVTKVMQGYKYRCFDEGVDIFAAAVISSSQDLLTAVLPTFLYWNLKIPWRQKLALFSIFAIGYCVVAVGALRAYYSWYIFFETYDVTWFAWDALVWTLVELHVGAMCANAPALKVFFKQYLKPEKFTANTKSQSRGFYTKGSGVRSFTSKANFWRLGKPHSKYGYLSEPHTETSVDSHSVQIQKNIHASHSPFAGNGSTDITPGYLDDDIEMGSFHAKSNFLKREPANKEDFQALPRTPPHSQLYTPTISMPRTPPLAAAQNSFSPFNFRYKESREA